MDKSRSAVINCFFPPVARFQAKHRHFTRYISYTACERAKALRASPPPLDAHRLHGPNTALISQPPQFLIYRMEIPREAGEATHRGKRAFTRFSSHQFQRRSSNTNGSPRARTRGYRSNRYKSRRGIFNSVDTAEAIKQSGRIYEQIESR